MSKSKKTLRLEISKEEAVDLLIAKETENSIFNKELLMSIPTDKIQNLFQEQILGVKLNVINQGYYFDKRDRDDKNKRFWFVSSHNRYDQENVIGHVFRFSDIFKHQRKEDCNPLYTFFEDIANNDDTREYISLDNLEEIDFHDIMEQYSFGYEEPLLEEIKKEELEKARNPKAVGKIDLD